jgi:hypothetical protein
VMGRRAGDEAKTFLNSEWLKFAGVVSAEDRVLYLFRS